MTFLSVTPDTFAALPALPKAAAKDRRASASRLAHVVALMPILLAVTVPDAVAHAKWTKAGLILSIVQHRCLGSFSA